jgi:hypothetical protein
MKTDRGFVDLKPDNVYRITRAWNESVTLRLIPIWRETRWGHMIREQLRGDILR